MGDSTGLKADPDGVRLVNLALAANKLSPDQWADALAEKARQLQAGRKPDPLTVIIVSKGYLTEEELAALKVEADQVDLGGSEEIPDLVLPKAPPPQKSDPQMFGHFRLVGEISRRRRTSLHEAFDTKANRKVLLKILLPGRVASEEETANATQRFKRDASFSLKLSQHATVAKVYEVGEVNGSRYIASEMIEGTSLSEWMKRKPALWERVTLLRDIAQGMHHAHEEGVIHQDLTPDRVLVDATGHPHVSEFGLAKAMRDITTMDTPSAISSTDVVFKSPEIVKNSNAGDRRSDVYSMGAILYQLVSGKLPYQGKTAVETAMNVTKGNLKAPSEVGPEEERTVASRELDRICLRALAPDPRKRQQTAEQLSNELSAWLRGDSVPHTPHWVRPALIIAAIFGVLLAILLAIYTVSS